MLNEATFQRSGKSPSPAVFPVFSMTAFTVLAHWKAFSASHFRLSSEAVKGVKRPNGNAVMKCPLSSAEAHFLDHHFLSLWHLF